MKYLKIIGIVLLVIIAVILVFLVISYINHKIQLGKENEIFKTNGTPVEVDGHEMNVYTAGNQSGELTLVFMSGAGTCSPTLDFKSLYSLFEKDYRIAVVEKAGYGFSEISGCSRDIDTMLDETRTALQKAGVSGGYVLFPHSMSGIEAVYWANKYPDEVKGIVGLDPAVPQAYADMNISGFGQSIAKFGVESGIVRFFPSIADDSAAIKYGTLTEDEKELYRAIFYRRTMTDAMINETKCVKENAAKLAKIDDTDVPMLFFVSNGEGTGYDKEAWRGYIEDYLKDKHNGSYVELECSHYVHDIEYKKIYEESLEFLNKLQEAAQ
ncbi:MAG: alpha/beta fold hydrolase [Acutalibacteraceae bacterium]